MFGFFVTQNLFSNVFFFSKGIYFRAKFFFTIKENFLLYEYKDLFIDMAVRNNRSELAIANRHQER